MPKRHWLQFGLRGFLLCAVGLSMLFGWMAHERRRSNCISKFMKAGTIEFDEPTYLSPRRYLQYLLGDRIAGDVRKIDLRYAYVNDNDLAGVELFPEATILDVSHTSLTNVGLSRLRHLKHLRELYIGGQFARRISDEGLQHFSNLKKLRVLELRRTSIRGPGLIALSNMRDLEVLSLWNSDIDDRGLSHLQRLTGLKKLVVGHTKLSQAAIEQLRATLPNCQVVDDV